MTEMKLSDPSAKLLRIAGWCAYLSGIVSVFGILFLLAFFGGAGGKFGTLNDIALIIQYVLMLPIAFTFWRYLRENGEQLNHFAFLIGLIGIFTVIVLQGMLLSDQIIFESYIVIVSAGFLVTTLWFVITGVLGRRGGDKLPGGMGMDIFAGLYLGYPIWAYRVGKKLLSLAD